MNLQTNDPLIEWNYDDWNRAIAEKFFNCGQAHRAVYLYIDDEALQEMAVQHDLAPEAARESFVNVVVKHAYRLRQNKSQPFFKILQIRIWEGKCLVDPREPPPFIAFLGLCVLAATDMTLDDTLNINSANYYVRLNKLLGLTGGGQPTGFDKIEDLWERLNKWLADDLQGEFGLPTATNHPHRHVSYPISQALMRRTDIEELPDFFNWCGLDPGEELVDSGFFKQQLSLWAQRTTCSFSKQLKLVFERNQQEHIQAIAERTLAFYQNWDGSKISRQNGLRSTTVVIQLLRSGRSFELALHPRAPREFPEGRYGSEMVSRVDDSEWFYPLSGRLLAQWLSGVAIELQQLHYCLKLPAQFIVPLRSDTSSDLGGWLACNRVGLGEKHVVLCHKDLQQRVKTYFEHYGEAGWRVVPNRDPIYKEWVCFDHVRIVKFAKTDQHELDCLVPTKQAGIRLSGGLPLKRGVWLKGGEPEAVISTDLQLPVYLDQEEVAITEVGSTIINLQAFDFYEGSHVLLVGEKRTTFAISEAGNKLLGEHHIKPWGYLFQRLSDTEFEPLSLSAAPVPEAEEIPSGQLYVSGTHILHSALDPPPPRQHLVVLPYGAATYIILGRRIGDILEPDLPTFLTMGEENNYVRGYKQQVSFAPQWLITISDRKNKTLRPLGHPRPPLAEVAAGEGQEAWLNWTRDRRLSRRLSKKHAQWAKIWVLYNQMAQRSR